MGICIHFRVQLKSPKVLPQLIEEARDIAVENIGKQGMKNYFVKNSTFLMAS